MDNLASSFIEEKQAFRFYARSKDILSISVKKKKRNSYRRKLHKKDTRGGTLLVMNFYFTFLTLLTLIQ